jgi:flagellar protein FliO/FliZ
MESTSFLPLIWLIVVIALIPAVLWLVKRLGLVKLPATSGLKTISIQALSPTHRIQTVEIGEGDQRVWLVLGVTPHSITTLHTLPPGHANTPTSASVGTPGATFAQALAALRGSGGSKDGSSGR